MNKGVSHDGTVCSIAFSFHCTWQASDKLCLLVQAVQNSGQAVREQVEREQLQQQLASVYQQGFTGYVMGPFGPVPHPAAGNFPGWRPPAPPLWQQQAHAQAAEAQLSHQHQVCLLPLGFSPSYTVQSELFQDFGYGF